MTHVEHQAPRERGRPYRERKRSWTLLANFSWLRSEAHIPALAQHTTSAAGCSGHRVELRLHALKTVLSVGVGCQMALTPLPLEWAVRHVHLASVGTDS